MPPLSCIYDERRDGRPHNECKATTQTLSHDRRTATPPYSWRRQYRTSHFHFPSPLLPHCGNGFSDLCLPITIRFTQLNRQTASLIDTHQTSWTHRRRLHRLMPAASTGDSRCLWDDRDEGNCVWDGNDDPDDDLIRRVFVMTEAGKSDRGSEIKTMRRSSYGFRTPKYQ